MACEISSLLTANKTFICYPLPNFTNTANASGKTWHIINIVTKVTIKAIPFSSVSNFLIPITYWWIAPIAIPKKHNGIL